MPDYIKSFMQEQQISNHRLISIKQHNALTEARYDMSPLQKNMLYLLLVQINEEDLPEDGLPKEPIKYKLSLKEVNASRNIRVNKSELLHAAKYLISSGLSIYDTTQKKLITIGILEYAEYGEEADKDNLIVQFDPKLYPFLYNVKNRYTLFTLKNALNLKSKYSKRIYEMLSQFKNTGIWNISVQELKERFGLIDLQTGKETYPDFGDFARRILEPAKKEINDHTDIRVDYETEKTGRKITHLKFKIRSKKVPKELPTPNQEASQNSPLEARLVNECKVSKVLARDVIKSFPVEKIEGVVNGILKENQEGKIKKLGAYSKTIFEEWLNGAEPTFEKTATKIKHVPLKSASQTDEIVALEHELEKRLAEFGLGRSTVYGLLINYGGDLGRLEELRSAISKVDELIEKKEVESNPDSIFETLKIALNGKVEEVNQPLVIQSNDRSNSMNSLGSLLASSIPRPQKQVKLSPEEELIRKEENEVWEELVGRFPNMSVEEVDELLEDHSVKNLNYAISKVVEAVKTGKIPEESTSMIQELHKHLKMA